MVLKSVQRKGLHFDVSSASHVCRTELRLLKDFSQSFAIRNRIFPIKAQGINHLECSSNNCCCNPKVIFSVTGTGHSKPVETYSMSHEVKVRFAHSYSRTFIPLYTCSSVRFCHAIAHLHPGVEYFFVKRN